LDQDQPLREHGVTERKCVEMLASFVHRIVWSENGDVVIAGVFRGPMRLAGQELADEWNKTGRPNGP
jgi:hypothetical protein